MDIEEKSKILEELIKSLDSMFDNVNEVLRSDSQKSFTDQPDYQSWLHRADITLSQIFGSDSHQMKRINKVPTSQIMHESRVSPKKSFYRNTVREQISFPAVDWFRSFAEWHSKVRGHLECFKGEPIFIQNDETKVNNDYYVDLTRIRELKAIKSECDLKKLIELCEELNINSINNCYLAIAMLVRSILDHVAPIFGVCTFSEVASNYGGTRSFKEQMKHLDISSRKIADAHLHTQIRSKETLPTKTQINFSNDLDVLLAEIIRIIK